ncbi:MAG: DICT sensory domain-containing protein [Halanaeroarchaeum sp.]
MSLESFVDEVAAGTEREYTFLLVNQDNPDPVDRMVDRLFADQPIDLDQRSISDVGEDRVLLVADGEVVATSPMDRFQREILFVNSDRYTTGDGHFEVDLPDVLVGMEDELFVLRGYPESDTEKLLLIGISRYLERLAWRHDGGRLRSSFQDLSRLRDERGTRSVYEEIAERDVSVHVYGVPDWIPQEDLGVVVHGGYTRPFRDFWFVIARPEADDDGECGVLLAEEVESGTWRGFWTFRPDRVEAIEAHVERTM